jgi:tetratricopeptide (TPR) repeat protein
MKRVSPMLWLLLLLAACFSLATTLQPLAATWSRGGPSGSVLKLALGDGRRLFANHFFIQADVSFHRGYYPSVFDAADKPKVSAMAAGPAGHDEDEHRREMALGQPRDWIDAFSRNFHFKEDSHLENGQEREILPWLWLSAELDPQRVETYTVASYWLCKRLDKAKEAEAFLREGIRNNPGSPEILYELGRLYLEDRHEPDRARKVWDLALVRWNSQEAAKPEPNLFLLEQITVRLANLEADAGNLPRAINLMELAKKASPHPEAIQKQIEELRQKAAAPKKD